MRAYVSSVLNKQYHCLTSDNGMNGIIIAKDKVPDIIICDVMMPGIDGYEVARQLRANMITSHIPIILLTAKGDKQSRIQGWSENIDDYMTKPFDEYELLTRVDNIISIRSLLSQRIANNIGEVKNNSEIVLNKTEQAFLNKFMKIIEKNFSNERFQQSDFLDTLYISKSQLHRKIKALTNKTPMELLREYRLEKSIEYLRDGETVTRTIEYCGFNSASNFSKSFKALYGVSPKQYQLENKL